MPIHDWSRVPAGIFHHFHHDWITEIARALNRGALPRDYYALAEQVAAGVGPDVLTLHSPAPDGDADREHGREHPEAANGGGLLLARPKTRPIAETEMAFYRRKKSLVAVRHVSDDRVVAVVEVVSPGNKSTRNALEEFVRKVADFLNWRVHLLILDLFPPGRHDPQGIHGAIWEYVADQTYSRLSRVRCSVDRQLYLSPSCVAFPCSRSSAWIFQSARLRRYNGAFLPARVGVPPWTPPSS